MVSLFEKERVSLVPSHLGDPEYSSCTFYMVYGIDGREVILRKGYLLGEYDEYHDLVNPYIMKTKVNRVRYID